MKTKKIVAMLLALVMVVGAAAACGGTKTTDTTTAAPETTVAETTAAPAETTVASPTGTTPEDIIDPATDVTDEDTTPIVIYAWNEEFKGLLDKYYVADNAGFTYDYQVTENTTYQTKLDGVLASGDGAPDIFLLEADYAKKYVDSDYTLNINELGISNKELADQYKYTYDFMLSKEGAVKALSWQACPAGVFYNRTLAKQYIGSDDPATVSKSFATWDAFLALAQKVNKDSAGKVKAISGYDDLWRSFQNSRSQGWLVDGKITIDPQIEKYFDYAKQLKDEGLTFETAQWNTDWTANMSNSTVLSYWGPMWLLNFCMGFGYNDDGTTIKDGANPTTGDWGYVNAPVPYFWGGTWIAASKYDNNKATSAAIMRYFTIDSKSMDKLAQNGEFVNNVPVMAAIGEDSSFGVKYLGGQNPFSDLLATAKTIDVSAITGQDQAINTIFNSVVAGYTNGEIATVADAEAAFIADCNDAGIGA